MLLMKPEYRKNIDPKYSRKIEAVVRKPPKSEKDGELMSDPIEPLNPCPYCESMLPETEISCNNCTNNIPFCIVTVGKTKTLYQVFKKIYFRVAILSKMI